MKSPQDDSTLAFLLLGTGLITLVPLATTAGTVIGAASGALSYTAAQVLRKALIAGGAKWAAIGGLSGISATVTGVLGAAFTLATGPVGITVVSAVSAISAAKAIHKALEKSKQETSIVISEAALKKARAPLPATPSSGSKAYVKLLSVLLKKHDKKLVTTMLNAIKTSGSSKDGIKISSEEATFGIDRVALAKLCEDLNLFISTNYFQHSADYCSGLILEAVKEQYDSKKLRKFKIEELDNIAKKALKDGITNILNKHYEIKESDQSFFLLRDLFADLMTIRGLETAFKEEYTNQALQETTHNNSTSIEYTFIPQSTLAEPINLVVVAGAGCDPKKDPTCDPNWWLALLAYYLLILNSSLLATIVSQGGCPNPSLIKTYSDYLCRSLMVSNTQLFGLIAKYPSVPASAIYDGLKEAREGKNPVPAGLRGALKALAVEGLTEGIVSAVKLIETDLINSQILHNSPLILDFTKERKIPAKIVVAALDALVTGQDPIRKALETAATEGIALSLEDQLNLENWIDNISKQFDEFQLQKVSSKTYEFLVRTIDWSRNYCKNKPEIPPKIVASTLVKATSELLTSKDAKEAAKEASLASEKEVSLDIIKDFLIAEFGFYETS